MTDRRRRVLAGAAVVAAGLAGAACGASDDDRALLPAAVAADLAERSETVAQTLQRGDGCGAARQAEQLQTAVDRAVAGGHVPVELRAELRRRASDLARSIVCVRPPPVPAGDEEDDGDDDHSGDDSEDDGDD